MSARPNIIRGPIDVRNALAELGLRPEYLIDAIIMGEAARDGASSNDPPGAPGYFAWSYTVRGLREILVEIGWWPDDDDGISLAVSPDGSIAIDVITGNIGTGNPDATPNTKYPKGPATERAVSTNPTLIDLLEWEEGAIQSPRNSTRQTWMLLRKRVGDDVFAELSLPESMTEEGYVERWTLRIMLDIDLGGFAIQDESSEPPIVVPVIRRR